MLVRVFILLYTFSVVWQVSATDANRSRLLKKAKKGKAKKAKKGKSTTTTTKVRDQFARSGPYTIALWGDLPYRGDTIDVFENGPEDNWGDIYKALSDSVNDSEVEFVIHSGDIKSGGASCGELSYTRFVDMMNSFEAPGLLSLGDNDWTDCHRLSNGNYDPLELLDDLRKRFYTPTGDTIFGEGSLETMIADENYPEVQMFVYGDVLYINAHIVGSNNGLYDSIDRDCDDYLDMIDPGCAQSISEAKARSDVVNDFISDGFEIANDLELSGVMVAIQANIFNGPCGSWPDCDISKPVVVSTGFTDFWENLVAETVEFEKPVVLFHGDYHYYQVFPNPDNRASNLVAVQNPGSGSIGWIKTVVDIESPEVFTFEHMDFSPPAARSGLDFTPDDFSFEICGKDSCY